MNAATAIAARLRPGDTASVYVDAAPGKPADVQTLGLPDTTALPSSLRLFMLPTLGSGCGHPWVAKDAQPHGDSGRIVEREP